MQLARNRDTRYFVKLIGSERGVVKQWTALRDYR